MAVSSLCLADSCLHRSRFLLSTFTANIVVLMNSAFAVSTSSAKVCDLVRGARGLRWEFSSKCSFLYFQRSVLSTSFRRYVWPLGPPWSKAMPLRSSCPSRIVFWTVVVTSGPIALKNGAAVVGTMFLGGGFFALGISMTVKLPMVLLLIISGVGKIGVFTFGAFRALRVFWAFGGSWACVFAD